MVVEYTVEEIRREWERYAESQEVQIPWIDEYADEVGGYIEESKWDAYKGRGEVLSIEEAVEMFYEDMLEWADEVVEIEEELGYRDTEVQAEVVAEEVVEVEEEIEVVEKEEIEEVQEEEECRGYKVEDIRKAWEEFASKQEEYLGWNTVYAEVVVGMVENSKWEEYMGIGKVVSVADGVEDLYTCLLEEKWVQEGKYLEVQEE